MTKRDGLNQWRFKRQAENLIGKQEEIGTMSWVTSIRPLHKHLEERGLIDVTDATVASEMY